jgi:membrane protein required for colicin V production
MLIDLIVLVLLVWAILKGLRKGFIIGIFSLLSFIIGLAAAIKLSAAAAVYINENLQVSQRWLPVLAFAVVFILVSLLVHLGAKALEGMVRLAMLGWLNKAGGVMLFALLYQKLWLNQQ